MLKIYIYIYIYTTHIHTFIYTRTLKCHYLFLIIHKTGNLHGHIKIFEGARVMLIHNMDLESHLINRSTGLVIYIEMSSASGHLHGTIYVIFDDRTKIYV